MMMKKIYNIKVSTLIMIFLPILSIIIGYFGVKFYLLSNNNFNDSIDLNKPGVEEIIENEDENEDEENFESDEDSETTTVEETENNTDNSSTNKKITSRIKNISFYSIQVGSFSNNENAEEFKKELADEGYYAYILENQNFKVFVSASDERENLEDSLEAVKSFSPDAFVKRIDLESKNFSYVIENKDYFIEISQLIAKQINNINSTIALDEIQDQLEEIEKKNALFIEADENNGSIGQLVKNYVKDVKEYIGEINSNNENKMRILFEKNIDLFMKNFR